MGLLDAFYDPNSAGLLAIGTGLLDASGPSRMPIGLGQALGGAMNRGAAAYQQAREIADRARMQSLQAQAMQESLNQARAMHPLQLQQLQSSIAQQAAQRKQAERSAADEDAAREWVKNFSNPTARFGQQSGSLAPTQQNADAFAAQPASAPGLRDMVTAMALSGNPVLVARAETLKALLPKVKEYNKVMVNDQAVYQPMFEDGSVGAAGSNPAADRLAFQNLGGKTVALNPFSGQQVAGYQNTLSPESQLSANVTMRGQNMTDARERMQQGIQHQGDVAFAKKMAEGRASAIQTLPQVQSTADQLTRNIDELIGQRDARGDLVAGAKPHPGFGTSVGAGFGRVTKHIPGTEAADFNARVDQLLGGAFMQAFQSLKGGGQITEVEGKKATDAITRMSTSQSEREFVQAAQEFKGIVQGAATRARIQAGASGGAGISVRRYNPATGRIE